MFQNIRIIAVTYLIAIGVELIAAHDRARNPLKNYKSSVIRICSPKVLQLKKSQPLVL